MEILNRKGDINVLFIDDDDDAFLEDGIQILILTGEEFTSIIQNLPQEMGQKYLDVHKNSNFKHHCGNQYYSSGDKIICQECNEIVVLTNREEHNKGCWEAAKNTIGTCPICKRKKKFLHKDTTPQKLGVCLDCWIKRGKEKI